MESRDLGAAFVDRSRRYLVDSFLPRIRVALEQLSDEDLWWRPNEASNSAGNLVLHLCGNARQWIVSGVGGEADVRQREQEFDERGPLPRAALLGTLDATFADLERTLRRVDPGTLLEVRAIQGREVPLYDAILHVVEHVSHHTGQLLWIAKARGGRDLGLWRVEGGKATPTWTGESSASEGFVGLISDTHGLLRPEALAALQGSRLILHAGDVGDAAILERLGRIAPVAAVYGNTDSAELRARLPEREIVAVGGGVQVCLIHVLDDLDLDPAAAGCAVVVYGHTHQPRVERRGGIWYVNPGSAGPRRLKLPVTVARMFVEPDGGVRTERVELNV